MIELPVRQIRVRRYFWLPLGLAALLVALTLAALVTMSWRSLERLQPIKEHLAQIARIQDVGLTMEQTLLKGLRGSQIRKDELDGLQRDLVEIADLEKTLHPDTGRRLREIAQHIATADTDPVGVLFETLAQLRAVLAAERAQHDGLLLNVAESTRMELRLSVVLLLIVPLGGGLAMLWLQQRAYQPLSDLQNLFDRLAGRDFQRIPPELLEQTTKVARPAFESYNAMVVRLEELEAEHQNREQLLEHRVRKATEALLEQSRELSRAERLAAVGAVSAGLAHELRNPLAGIQLACAKLKQKIGDSDQSARITAVISELQRINHLLTEQVDAARHAPEPSVEVNIATVLTELMSLLRYQVPTEFELSARVDGVLHCVLPAAGLRQAVLNLVLNAVQVQGDSGWVEVTAETAERRLILRVSDNGPGFPAAMLRAGIRPFATGRAGGTGLGLAMVRRFARDLDGDLKLENRAPRGAQVTLTLPCASLIESGNKEHA